METTKKTKKSWNERDTSTVAWHSKGIKAKDACKVLEKILLDRTPAGILSKIYDVQAIEKANALKAYRAQERTMGMNLVQSKEVVETEVISKESTETDVAVKERIEEIKDVLFCEKIISYSNSEEDVVEDDDDVNILNYFNKTIPVFMGTINVPFAGRVECDFEITGTFSIKRINKKTLI